MSAERILIVDDDPEDLVAVAATLEALGRTVVSERSGEGALRRLLEGDFALVILDLLMPGINGLELAAMIRERERTRDVPILFLTGMDPRDVRRLPGYRDELGEFLRKPVTPESLRDKAAGCLDAYAQAHSA